MHKNNIANESYLVHENIENSLYFGTHTIRYLLRMYRMQYVTVGAQLKNIHSITHSVDLVHLAQRYIQLEFQMKELQRILLCAQCKPPLSMCRRSDWFFMNERVICFVPESESLFIEAQIYNDNGILHDGQRALSVVYDWHIIQNCFLNGYGGLYSICDPYILKQWEYEYLKTHLQFARLWIRYCVRSNYSFGEAIYFSHAL